MEITKRCGGCKWRLSEVCHKWKSDSGYCEKCEHEREFKLENKDGVKFVLKDI